MIVSFAFEDLIGASVLIVVCFFEWQKNSSEKLEGIFVLQFAEYPLKT